MAMLAEVMDVMKSAPRAYNMLLENKRVRVMEIRLKPGEKASMHNHPNDHVVYVLRDARVKLTFLGGKSNEDELKAGKIIWMEAGSHETENIGTTDMHNLVIEIKK